MRRRPRRGGNRRGDGVMDGGRRSTRRLAITDCRTALHDPAATLRPDWTPPEILQKRFVPACPLRRRGALHSRRSPRLRPLRPEPLSSAHPRGRNDLLHLRGAARGLPGARPLSRGWRHAASPRRLGGGEGGDVPAPLRPQPRLPRSGRLAARHQLDERADARGLGGLDVCGVPRTCASAARTGGHLSTASLRAALDTTIREGGFRDVPAAASAARDGVAATPRSPVHPFTPSPIPLTPPALPPRRRRSRTAAGRPSSPPRR